MKREEADNLLHQKVEAGELVSPVLPGGVKNYLIDIDGTITEDVPNEEPERMGTCLPFVDALETCNRWFKEGHMICFFTSRTYSVCIFVYFSLPLTLLALSICFWIDISTHFSYPLAC